MPPRIALRADASARLGLGHVKRCLALGMALREVGAEPVLIARRSDVDIASLARGAGVEHLTLLEDGSWEDDARNTCAALGEPSPQWLVVDHYELDARWHKAMAHQLNSRIAAIDDLADRPLDVTLLIDHNIARDHRAKYAGRIGSRTSMLAGPRFALLSPAYATAPRYEWRDEVRSIGIFMGGGDANGMSKVVLEACRDVAGFIGSIEIAATSAHPWLTDLREACRRSPRVSLTVDAPDLTAFFARHDLQVGAGGGASLERCCIGAPTLGLVCADNQKLVIHELSACGAIAALEPGATTDASGIGSAVAELMDDAQRRRSLSATSRRLVDGFGTRRVALYLNAGALRVRRATREDAQIMHAWRNHEATRRHSHDASAIPLLSHVAWLERVLTDDSRLLLVGLVGSVPVGVIRLDVSTEGVVNVSLYLDPALHGLGLGKMLLKAGEGYYLAHCGPPIGGFVATVLEANAASQALFRSAGYEYDGGLWRKAGSAHTTRCSP